MAEALDEIDRLFGDSGEESVVTLLFRGDVLTPGGVSQMDALIEEIGSDPSVRDLLAPEAAVVAPSSLLKAILSPGSSFRLTDAG